MNISYNNIETRIISLKHRSDRRDLFKKTNDNKLGSYEFVNAVNGREITYNELKKLGYDTQDDWIDPLLNTKITKGEIGCFLSHYKLWKECISQNTPFLIVEDDAVVKKDVPYDEIKELINQEYDFIYLGWLEMNDKGSLPINDKFVVPVYPYWTLAYVITPQSAKVLVDKNIENNIIPVDEYLPIKMKELNPIAYKDHVIIPLSRSEGGSDIHAKERYDYFIDFNVHVVTVGTDKSRCQKLYHSAGHYGIDIINLGQDIEWKGGTMSGPGGGQKVNLLKEYIKELPNRDVILFCDGYDVFIVDNIDEMAYRYLEMRKDVIFGAERVCWPDDKLSDDMIALNRKLTSFATPYEYLNSGLFIGKVSELKKILDPDIDDGDDDQLYCQKQYLTEKYDIILDQDSYIFQNHEPEVYKKKTQMYNPLTRCYNCVYHGNGGTDAKLVLNRLYNQFYSNHSPIVYVPTHNKYELIGDEMLLIDYMTPSMCDDLIDLSDEDGGWNSLDYDSFPAKEIRMKKLGLWDEMERHWKESIYPIVHSFWSPFIMYGIRDAFVMRYSLDTQTKLNLHCDASVLTGSVKLNDNYEGADLVFPRQKFSNKDVPVGKCILFPGQLTHGHECQELISGVKYSLTIWTSRYTNDLV
jgi:GR25 family glycosyltransferase involved in LPS biosynthesis